MKEVLVALAFVTPAELPEDGLASFRWDARPVLVFAEADDPRLERQLMLFEANAADMAERRNLVIVDTGAGRTLRARFQPEGFTVILVGLDGGEKFRSGSVVDPNQLDKLIDRMPMRRREMRE
jgi:hypothetical protein